MDLKAVRFSVEVHYRIGKQRRTDVDLKAVRTMALESFD